MGEAVGSLWRRAETTGARALLELQGERKREQSKLQGEKFQLDGSKTNFTTRGVNHRARSCPEITADTESGSALQWPFQRNWFWHSRTMVGILLVSLSS